MMVRPKTRWILLLSLVVVLAAFSLTKNLDAQKSKWVGTQTCIDCHQTWLDNNPPTEDIVEGAVSLDYPPLNLSASIIRDPWYTIPEAYVKSIHNIPAFNLTATDEVPCEACHGSGAAHYGTGSIPVPLPNTKTCASCHKAPYFEISAFLKTSHANSNNKPGKYYDQPNCGIQQAKTRLAPISGSELVPLFKGGTFEPLGDIVTRNERIEECSVCHHYALQYPRYRKKIELGNIPGKPEVSCGACHDAHIVAPSGLDPAIVTTTVAVSQVTGTSTVVSATKVPGREVSYINNKPYPIGESGAINTREGTWTRGSSINRPSITLIKGTGRISNENGISDLLTLECDSCVTEGGFLKNNVKYEDTLFIWGEATATTQLPSDALHAGKSVTVKATLERTGFTVHRVINEKRLLIELRSASSAAGQLGTDKIAAVASANVTYVKTDNKSTGTLTVYVPFNGTFSFEIRDMHTNTANLCGSCHTQGTYKYTKWGQRKSGALIDLSSTHNKNIGGQFNVSGHSDIHGLAWKEFSANDFGSSHQQIYPYDMSITGSGGAGSLRNGGNATYNLTQTPDRTKAYLSQGGNLEIYGTSNTTLINNYACFQCHHGLAAIDYLEDRQGTSGASVLWGDSTVTCITCHDPHKDQGNSNGRGPNIRVPVKLSYNTTYFADAVKNPKGGINKFLDGTDIPSGVGNNAICLFCHQGRESGYTIYANLKSKGLDPYTDPNKVASRTFNFQNPHYLDGGAILWSKNAFEYLTVSGTPTPNKYSTGISDHQEMNCAGCHMAEPSANGFEGGHTWRPTIEACKKCHTTATNFFDIMASADYNGNGVRETAFAELGTINPDSGLFGQLKAALQTKGIYYDPDVYPYFMTASGTAFNTWSSNTLSAAFNLSYAYKAGNAAYVHNSQYIAQLLIDSLKTLEAPVQPWVRPSGNRNAIDYRTIVINP